MQDQVKATGEASGKRGAYGQSADVPREDGGVAAASTSSSRRSRKPKLSLVLQKVVSSRVGVCLHYEQDGRLIRENLTVEKCDERIAALQSSATAVALWTWKKEQIENNPPL